MPAWVSLTALLLIAGCSPSQPWQTAPLPPSSPALAFELRAADGRSFDETELREKVVLLFFGYTSCPDACPATLSRLRQVIAGLPESAQDDIRVLFVSVDPQRDTPERLAAYVAHYGPQFVGATTDEEGLRVLSSRYGSSFRHEPPNRHGYYTVVHASTVWVFGRDGRARLLLRPDHPLEAIAHDLRRLLEEPAPG